MKVDKLQESLCTSRLARRIVLLHEIDSTNDYAKKLAEYGAEEGTVVVAEEQILGRGRAQRKWVSPKGGLYFSIILRPNVKASEAVKLMFVASLAVAKVLHEKYGLNVETKWPNDVLVDGKKICGILSEMNTISGKANYVVVGVGINANVNVEKDFPAELKPIATSLESLLGRKVSLEELFKTLLQRLDEFYGQFLREDSALIVKEWKKYASFLGCQVKIVSGREELHGLALDVNDEGALVIRLEDGTETQVFVGDISLQKT